MEKYKVEIRVKQYNVGTPPITITTNYLCQDVVGGLSDLETVLEFDEDWFGFQYSYSNTTLKFCKRDKAFLLQYITGLNYWSGGVLQQDFSYSLDYLPEVKITEFATNTVIIQSHLDLNTLKIHPDYFEIALIDNADLKERISRKITYSLKELDPQIVPMKTDYYSGNNILEKVTLYGNGLPDFTWGSCADLKTPSDTPHVFQNNWNNGHLFAATSLLKPRHGIVVQGEGTIYAPKEYWGQFGGYVSQLNTSYFNYAAQILPISSQMSEVGGFSLPAAQSREVDFKINFHLGRGQYLAHYLQDSNSKKWLTFYMPYSFGKLKLYLRLTKDPNIDANFYQDILITTITPTINQTQGTYNKWWEPAVNTYELYEVVDFEYHFSVPAAFNGVACYGNFYMEAENQILGADLVNGFTRGIYGDGSETYLWKTYLDNMYQSGGNPYNYGTPAHIAASSPYMLSWQGKNDQKLNAGDNSEPVTDYSFKCEAVISGVANSIQNKRNDLYGVPILDYANFVASKGGLSLDVSRLQSQGINNIMYGSENLVNYEKQKQEKADEYLATNEEVSLQDVLDWLNKQFCLSMYYYNSTLVVMPRAYFVAVQSSNVLNLSANRIIELEIQKAAKTLKLGSKNYEVDFVEKYEVFNFENELTSGVPIGDDLDLVCPIVTNPQFIDWLLVAKELNGNEQYLVETRTINGDIQLYTFAEEKIKENKQGGSYMGQYGAPTFATWQQRKWLNIFLSPLAQYERWRKFLPPTAHNSKYAITNSPAKWINYIYNIYPVESYQQIYRNIGTAAIWNNSNTIIQNIDPAQSPTAIGQPFLVATHVSPIRVKIETPIYKEFVGNVPAQACRFQYNGKMIQGIPIAIHTYFDKKVQEIDLILLNTNFSITDLFN